jgi:hypothetical protein
MHMHVQASSCSAAQPASIPRLLPLRLLHMQRALQHWFTALLSAKHVFLGQ